MPNKNVSVDQKEFLVGHVIKHYGEYSLIKFLKNDLFRSYLTIETLQIVLKKIKLFYLIEMISKLSDKESHFNINESDLIFNAMLDKKLNFSENTGLLLTFILHSDFSEITLKKILENIDITKIIVYQKDLFNILNLELNQFPQSHRMLILNKLSLSSIIDPEKDYFKELFSLPAEQLTPVLCRLAFDKIISLRYTSLNLLSYLLTFNAEKLSDEARVKIWGRLKAELSTLINRFSDLEILLSLNKDQLPD